MNYFCTYFDKNYLPRGLALYHSLREHCRDFTLLVLCMDHLSFELLEKLDLPRLHSISLEDFELNDGQLLGAKQNRSVIEYYFTCTPSLPLYIFKKWPQIDLITYLDADLFFFASPSPLFDEIGKNSIAIIGHRFPSHLKDLESYGIFNVGWVSFKRDTNGLTCLKWWRQQCIEWCYDCLEDNRFADQKYLDDWPERFENVVILQHKGANLAPWNLGNFNLCFSNLDTVSVNDHPLIFYHFHELKRINTCFYNPNLSKYGNKPFKGICSRIYSPYLRLLSEISFMLLTKYDVNLYDENIRSSLNFQEKDLTKIQRIVSQVRKSIFIIRSILTGKLIFFVK